jgi:hypothetical protein
MFSNWPDIRSVSVSGKSNPPDTGYQKRPNYPVGYPLHPYLNGMMKIKGVMLDDNQ